MRRFGLIGYPLSHSFSQRFFTDKFQREGIADCVYENFPLPSIDGLKEILALHPDLEGLNVTIPYKEQVIPFLHHQHTVVKAIGACNCIWIIDGQLTGFNTDVVGFEVSLREYLQPHHNKALVLGTGGAAKAIHYVLQKLGIDFIEVSRTAKDEKKISYDQLTSALVAEYPLIINSTPLGTFPNVHDYPNIPYQAITSQHYLFDLVYNPAKTVFLQKGDEMGATIKNGHDMLVIQAEESWKIWKEGWR